MSHNVLRAHSQYHSVYLPVRKVVCTEQPYFIMFILDLYFGWHRPKHHLNNIQLILDMIKVSALSNEQKQREKEADKHEL